MRKRFAACICAHFEHPTITSRCPFVAHLFSDSAEHSLLCGVQACGAPSRLGTALSLSFFSSPLRTRSLGISCREVDRTTQVSLLRVCGERSRMLVCVFVCFWHRWTSRLVCMDPRDPELLLH